MINTVMRGGKKSVAERVVYGAFDRIAEKNKDKSPMDVLQAAMDNVKPKLEVKSRRVGGANYHLPLLFSACGLELLAQGFGCCASMTQCPCLLFKVATIRLKKC